METDNRILDQGRWGQGVPTTHCPACGLHAARLMIRGELSSLFECKACGHSFERDRPVCEQHLPFRTQARCLWGAEARREAASA